ncbi:indolepyruvate oxidoreductase subunit beta [Candidatus Eisenbacteria bacterium]|uniref:Indolepyruvate oxidoreductase subunit beta n=1 Tax=Eiseniibacteriota bacterium TaxID=2212470 RepID=A0ABV6YI78_UNCEI
MQAGANKNHESARLRILIVGTGGQGVITAARLLTNFYVERGHAVVSGQLHGMAQRGGAVQASVMIDCGIGPGLPAGGANIVLGLEPVETARAMPFISSKTAVLMNTAEVVPYVLSQQYVLKQGTGRYPSLEVLQEAIGNATSRLRALDATVLAKRAGSIRAVNVVMLGCLFGAGLLRVSPEEFLEAIMRTAPPRLADVNRKAFLEGVQAGRDLPVLEEAR